MTRKIASLARRAILGLGKTAILPSLHCAGQHSPRNGLLLPKRCWRDSRLMTFAEISHGDPETKFLSFRVRRQYLEQIL